MNLDRILRDIPGHKMDPEAAERVRILVEGLEAGFTTRLSRIKEIDEIEEKQSVCVVFSTPYLSNSTEDQHKLLPNLFRLADAVSVSCTGIGEDKNAIIIFSVKVWD